MVRAGVDFDPVLVVKGAELVPPAAALFVTGHFRLNALWTRWLVDSGHKIAVVSGDPDLRVMGTSIPADILSGPNVLVATRSRLLSGGKVNCSIDSMIATPEWPRIETPAGPRWVSDVMPTLAERLRVPVLFMATRVDPDWNIVVTIEKPSTHDQATATREFCSFLLSQIAQIER